MLSRQGNQPDSGIGWPRKIITGRTDIWRATMPSLLRSLLLVETPSSSGTSRRC